VRAWIALAATLLTTLQVTACATGPASTCGMNGGRPHPEIGGEVLYYCLDHPAVSGGLYLLDVATGRVRALTSDLAYNLDGAWSPDGSRVAFQSSRDGRDDIYVMNLSSGSVRRLTDGRGFNEYPDWSPDGRLILFSSSRDGVNDPYGIGYYRDIYVMRADGSDTHRLSRHEGIFGGAAWNPDGRSLVFVASHGDGWDVFTMQADGSRIEQVTNFSSSGGGANYPRWSPDGSRVLYFGAVAKGSPLLIYWQATGQQQTHAVTVARPGQDDLYPDWSRDAKWIVFERTGPTGSELFAVRPDGTGLSQLTDGSGQKVLPRWRPA
jgi:Tol biopolymer transport system component